MTATRPHVTTLDNGLTCVLLESHDAPVATFWVWYRVGSRNEVPGLTGISHWVEHMQFKGTPTRGKGEIFNAISRNGGVNNAMTSHDWTAYYETLPADRIDLAIAIEADRMSNSLFDSAETESERTVILSERQGAENNPGYLLYEEVLGAAFRAHPYRHAVIGHEADLRQISRDDLYHHYQRHYAPNNAFVVAVGDFSAHHLADQIATAFGPIPRAESPADHIAAEPPQLGERRVTLRRPSPTAYLRTAYQGVAADHPDAIPLIMADAVLSGAKPMGMGGGGGMGRSSRLYRALVASGLARSAGSHFDLSLDAYPLWITATALPGIEPQRIEAVIEDELQKLACEPIPNNEFQRVMKQQRAQLAYAFEGVTNQAVMLGHAEIVSSWERSLTLLEEFERVTPEDISRVCAKYLVPERRTLGWLLPTTTSSGGGSYVDSPAAWRCWGLGGPARRPFERAELRNGIVVLHQPHPDDASVDVRIHVDTGSAQDPASEHGLNAFTARLLSRGTTATGSAEAFLEQIDNRGATLGVDPGRSGVVMSIRCLAEDLADLLSIGADALRNPLFPADEVEKVRAQMLTEIAESANDTRASASRVLRELLYPEDHPYRHPVHGDAESIEGLGADALARHHAATYGPNLLTIAAVGGFFEGDQLLAEIERAFGDWSGGVGRPAPAQPPLLSPGGTRFEEIAGKSQADIAAGMLTIPRSHPDHDALDMANLILGRLGLMGRLGANVRDKQGLAYYAYSGIDFGRTGSVWSSRAGVDPANVERAIAAIRAELERLATEGVSDDELEHGKQYLTGVLPLALEQNAGIANLLLTIERHQLGLDYVERYSERINAVNADQVRRAAETHLDPEKLAVAVARPSAS